MRNTLLSVLLIFSFIGCGKPQIIKTYEVKYVVAIGLEGKEMKSIIYSSSFPIVKYYDSHDLDIEIRNEYGYVYVDKTIPSNAIVISIKELAENE